MKLETQEIQLPSVEIHNFIDHAYLLGYLSDKSIKAYSSDLCTFEMWLFAKFSLQARQATNEHVISYKKHLLQANNTTRTINRKLSALRGFFKYLIKQDLVKNDPTSNIELLQNTKTLPKYITQNNLQKLFSVIEDDIIGVRNKVLLQIIYASGLRISECLNLHLKDIDLTYMVLRIVGKGDKERVVPFGNNTAHILEDYIQNTRKQMLSKYKITSDYMFFNNNAKVLNNAYVYRIIQKYRIKAGILGKLSAHNIRHTFATHMIDNGADIRAVQSMLGHSDISTTQIYVHTATSRTKQQHKKFHPRGQIDD